MFAETSAQAPIKDRIRAEQANVWIARWQANAPNVLVAALSGKSLAVHAVPTGACMFVLDWTGESVLLAETQGVEEPYRFSDVKSALVFLDALLMHTIAQREEAVRAAADPSAQRMAQPS